jgi:hypothetical protein
MPIRKQIASIALGTGIDRKNDPKIVPVSKLLTLANGRVGDQNTTKRFGYVEQSVVTKQTTGTGSTSVTGTLTQGSAFGAFKDELLLVDNNTIYAQSSSQNEWINKGVNIAVGVQKKQIQRNNNDLLFSDSAFFGGILFTIYYDVDDADYRVTVIDRTTGASYINDATVDASSGTKGYCKAIYLNGSFYGFYVDGNDLKYIRVNLSNLSQFIAAVTLVSGSANPRFDVARISDNQAAIAYNDTSNQTILGIFTASSAAYSTITISTDAVHSVSLVYSEDDQLIWVFFGGTNATSQFGRLAYGVYDSSLNQILAPAQVVNEANMAISRVVGVPVGMGKVRIWIEVDTTILRSNSTLVNTGTDTIGLGSGQTGIGSAYVFTAATTAPTGLTSGTTYYFTREAKLSTTLANALSDTFINITAAGSGEFLLTKVSGVTTNYIIQVTLTSGGSVDNSGDLFHGVTLASKPFSIGNGQVAFAAEYFSDLQRTSFLVLADGSDTATPVGLSVIAKFNVNRGKGLNTTPILPTPYQVDDNTYGISNSEIIRIEAEGTDYTFENGIVANEFLLDRAQRYFNDQIGDNTLIGGGIVKSYDGISATELNFNVFPEPVYAGFVTSGGSLAAGTYGFQCVYRWIDNQGLIHRSAPSVPVSVTTTGATSTIRVHCPYLNLTDKFETNGRNSVIIELYMTQLNGSLYYLRSTTPNIKINLTVPDPFQATFTITAAPSGSEELLYTTGGILENLSPPPSILVKATKNRAFLVNSENPKEFYFSKINNPSFGLAFSDVLRDEIPEGTTGIEALEAMDDKVVFFERSKMYFISGDGPNNLGINNTFTRPQLITNQVGSTNQDSTLFYAQGIAFQSPDKGIWLLSRDLQVAYLGADVEEFKDIPVVAANVIENVNELRFATGDGTQLVYDYFRQQWAFDTGLPAQDAIYQNDTYYLLRNSNGVVWAEDITKFTDNGGPIRMVVETPWIKASAVQGFQRVQRMALLGKFKSSHKLKIQIAYDYEDFYRDELIWDAGDIIGTSIFGDDALFGDDSVFGGVDDGVYQVRVHMPRQKCQSVKFRFEDISESDPGESMEMTALDLQLGVKQGLNKLREGKSI